MDEIAFLPLINRCKIEFIDLFDPLAELEVQKYPAQIFHTGVC